MGTTSPKPTHLGLVPTGPKKVVPSEGSLALSMTQGRRMYILSPTERPSSRIPGASCCFCSSYWAPLKGAALSVPVLISRTSPSTWRPPPPRRPVHFAATTHTACTAGTPAGSTTCPVSAVACGSRSPSAASFAHSLTAHAASSQSASRGSQHRGLGPPTGSGRRRQTLARPSVVRPAPAITRTRRDCHLPHLVGQVGREHRQDPLLSPFAACYPDRWP
jgi:hypothetical protein